MWSRVATKLRRSSIFEDFCPKIHLRLRLRSISRCWRIFEASKIWSRRFRRFLGKIYILLAKFVEQIPKNMYIAWKKLTIISIKKFCFSSIRFFSRDRHRDISRWQKFTIYLWKSSYLWRYSKNLQSSNIFEEFLNLRRIFVFVFGPFSESEDSSSSYLVHFQSSLQLC